MAQGGIGYAANGLVDGFLQGYQVFHKAKEDKEYKKLKTKFLQSQIDKNSRGPVARPVRDYTAINNRANAQAEYYNAKRKMLLNPAPTPPGDQEGIENSIPAPRSAIPPAPGGDQVSELQAPPEEEEQAPTVQSAATGGMISAVPPRNYAEGGDVDDDEEEEEDPEEEDDGATATSDSTQGSPQDYSIMAAHDAARDGIVHSIAQNNVGGHGLAVPAQPATQEANNRAHLTGKGAATHIDMERIRNKVDPDHKLEESDRNMAALSAVQSYYLKQNNPKAAQETAASMVGYFRKEFDRNKALASVAAEHGDIDQAINYAKKSYANLPDGNRLDVKKTDDGNYSYSVVDGRTNKSVFKPETVTPEVMLKHIQDSADATFDGLMASASGRRDGIKPPEKGPPEPRSSDYHAADEAIKRELSDTEKHPVPPEHKNEFHSVAVDIAARNRVTPYDATQAANELFDGKAKSKPLPGGGATFKLQNGQEYTVGKNGLFTLAAMRAKADAANKAKADAAAADKAKQAAVDKSWADARTQREATQKPSVAINPYSRAAKQAVAIPPRVTFPPVQGP